MQTYIKFSWLWVGLGGFIGSICRYTLGLWLAPLFSNWPISTLSVNLLGSFLLGLLVALSQHKNIPATYMLLVGTGFCGGFTTFSAFSVENMLLLQEGRVISFLFYSGASLVCGFAGAALGFFSSRLFY